MSERNHLEQTGAHSQVSVPSTSRSASAMMSSNKMFLGIATDMMLWFTFYVLRRVSNSRIHSRWLRECSVCPPADEEPRGLADRCDNAPSATWRKTRTAG